VVGSLFILTPTMTTTVWYVSKQQFLKEETHDGNKTQQITFYRICVPQFTRFHLEV
jgi:hypothetical protein